MKKLLKAITTIALLVSPTPVMAQIVNKALPSQFQGPGSAGGGFAFYIAQLWRTIVILGGIAFLLYFIWGSLEWLMSGGDKQKLESARSKITNGLIGLILLVASVAIAIFLGQVLNIDLLNIVWPTP